MSRSDVSWDTVLFKVVILDTKISWRWREMRKTICYICVTYHYSIMKFCKSFVVFYERLFYFCLFFFFFRWKFQFSSQNKWTHITLIFLFNFWLASAFCDADIRIQHEKKHSTMNMIKYIFFNYFFIHLNFNKIRTTTKY